MLVVESLDVDINGTPILRNIGLTIDNGEIIGLIGRNGAGKTSTLRTLARVDDPTLRKGEIWLDGQPLHAMKAHQAAQWLNRPRPF